MGVGAGAERMRADHTAGLASGVVVGSERGWECAPQRRLLRGSPPEHRASSSITEITRIGISVNILLWLKNNTIQWTEDSPDL
jgi:hypothetical protein